MATPTLWQLMEAIAEAAKTTGIRSAPESTGAINAPALMVGVPTVPEYRAAFGRGTVMITGWQLFILTSAKLDRAGQKALADYASWTGPKSIPLALEADKTLGGVAIDLAVQSFRPLGLEEVGIIQYFGGVLEVDVEVSGLE